MTAKAETPGGTMTINLFKAPEALVGNLKFSTTGGAVAGLDLTAMRQGTGQDVRGVLGMDFLKNFIVQINFDQGKLRFLRTVNRFKPGASVPIHFDEGNLPYVTADLPAWGEDEFLIDTGFVGLGSCNLRSSLFDIRCQRNKITPFCQGAQLSLSQSGRNRYGQIEGIRVGDVAHANLRCNESSGNHFGLGFLLRYNVTLDFPTWKRVGNSTMQTSTARPD